MRHTINGQRREDRARRTIAVGTLAAITPVLAPAITIWSGWTVRDVVLVTMLSTIAAAMLVGVLIWRVTRRMERQQVSFDDERRRWREEAQTDPLCRIANRRGAYDAVERLRGEAEDGARWTVLALDIDRFKEVNDTHGHAVGDRVLTAVASALSERLPAGAAVARWGGDEFVVFRLDHGDLPIEFAADLAAAVRRRSIPCREGDLHVDISFGLAHGPADMQFDDVLAVADDALLAAKAALRRPIELVDAPPMDEPAVVTVARRPSAPMTARTMAASAV